MVVILGLSTISKQEKEMPEDKRLSSGSSVIWGNMVKIDNYSNVSNYKYYTLKKQSRMTKEVSLLEKDYRFLEQIEFLDAEEYPQGLCIVDNYVFVSAYSGIREKNGVIKIFDLKSGQLQLELGMDARSHLGGIAYDGKNLWICNSSKMSLERMSFDFIQHMILEDKGKKIDVRNLMEIYPVKNIPSTVTFFRGQLWVTTHSAWSRSVMMGYLYKEDEKSLRVIGTFRVPSKVQGVAFSENGEVYLSTSYGRRKSSYIKRYKSIGDMSKNVENYEEKIELPPCSEGIVYLENKLYVLFESAGKKYLEGTDGKGESRAPLDRILVISTS